MTRTVDEHQRRYRRRILGVGAGLFVLTFLISAPFLLSGVENDLEDRIGDQLVDAGLDGVDVRFSGQDGTLTCVEPLDDPATVVDVATAEWGVRAIELEASCLAPPGADGGVPDDAVTAAPTTTGATGGSVSTAGSTMPATTAPATTAPATTDGIDPTTTPAPSPPDGVAELLRDDPQFSQFTGLLASAGDDVGLSTDGPRTVFAPTDAAFDAAFEALGPDAFAALTSDRERAEQLVLHHVADGLVTTDELEAGTLAMLDGDAVIVERVGDEVTLRSGDVVARVDDELSDLEASNGVVHAIDMVLLPGDVTAEPEPVEPDLAVELARGRYRLTGTVADDSQRQTLLEAFADEVSAANVDDDLVVDPDVGERDDAVDALARLVAVMPTNLAEGVAASTGGSRSISGVHLGGDRLLAIETVAAEVDASVELAPRPVADGLAAEALQDELNGFVRLNPVTFEPNSADLTDDAVGIVEQVAGRALVLDGVVIRIIGHTDSDGQSATNQQLSEDRATTVLDAFVEDGFDPADLSAEGRGEDEPILVDGVEDKAASRRVEFVVAADTGGSAG